jgi:hypothetical protein
MTGGGDEAVVRAASLAGLFAAGLEDFAEIRPVVADRVPEPFRSLLDHGSHMTVAMERFHGVPVGVRVLAEHRGPAAARYAREILLAVPDPGHPGGRTVQYGIVRIDLAAVDPDIGDRILRRDEPLGRILIEAGAHCAVRDVRLLEVVPGPRLRRVLGPSATFGRVAHILVGDRPAIELLEIVAAP